MFAPELLAEQAAAVALTPVFPGRFADRAVVARRIAAELSLLTEDQRSAARMDVVYRVIAGFADIPDVVMAARTAVDAATRVLHRARQEPER